MTLKYLLQKEFLQISRDKTILKMIVALPVIQLLILPWAATFEQHNIALSVVDRDHSTYSQVLIQKIVSSGFFLLTDYSNSYDKAIQSIERNESDLLLEIPPEFENNFVREQKTDLMISVNAVNGQKAGLGSSYLAQIIGEYNKDIVINHSPEAITTFKNIESDFYFKYNQEMNYLNYMVPGVLVMLLTLVGGMLSALNIVKEKEIGTIEQINVTPVSKGTFILAKLIPFWVIGLFILSIGMLIAWIIYGLVPAGSFFTIYLFAFVYLVAFSGLGLLISTYSNTQQQAMFVAYFLLIIFFLLSGLFTPISSMPNWVQIVTRFNPVRYFIEVIRLVYMKGASLTYILPQLGCILAFAVVFNTWAIVNYKKTS
ncbi:ABC transporter permease [Bacteroidales bacterium]|nr:ABC transporter permease [Bacteroidales bacterium]